MLDAISSQPDLSLSDLARGMVQRDPAAQSWSLGPGTLRLGSAYLSGSTLVERARPVLHGLALEMG